MRETKKITLSAMLTALGTVFMVLGAVFEVLDLSVCALASLMVVFAYIELGSPYTWLIWICTSLATALLFPGSIVWLEYLLVFGVYPILKAYIEKLPRWSWWPIKILFINGVVWALVFLVEWLLGVPFFDGDLFIIKVASYVLINVAFIAFDIFITIMVRLYFERFRHRFRKFLK